MKSNLGVWLVRARSAGNLYPKPHINMHQNKNFTNLILLTSNTKYYILEGWQEIKAPAICFNINPQLFFSTRFLTQSLTDCRKTTRIWALKSKLGGRYTKIAGESLDRNRKKRCCESKVSRKWDRIWVNLKVLSEKSTF